jgi:hypothetical protein
MTAPAARALPESTIAQLVTEYAGALTRAGFSEEGARVAATLLARLLRRVRLGRRPPSSGIPAARNGSPQGR